MLGSQRSSPIREKKLEPPPRKRNRSMSLSLSPSPDRNYNRHPLNDTTGTLKPDARPRDRPVRDRPRKEPTPEKKPEKELDPVLEARRRKFENPVHLEGNGIIKLKINKKEDDLKVEDDEEIKEEYEDEVLGEEEENQDEVDDLLDLNPGDDLWSDEESDNENEGRFKSTNKEHRTVPCLSFRKLTEKPEQKKAVLTNLRDNDRNVRDRRRITRTISRRDNPKDLDKSEIKSKIRLFNKTDIMKRKEIKIKENIERNLDDKRSMERNLEKKPSLERDVEKKTEVVEKTEKPMEEVRRVKIPKAEELEKEKFSPEEDDDDTEIIIENDDDDDDEDDSEIKDKDKGESFQNFHLFYLFTVGVF